MISVELSECVFSVNGLSLYIKKCLHIIKLEVESERLKVKVNIVNETKKPANRKFEVGVGINRQQQV